MGFSPGFGVFQSRVQRATWVLQDVEGFLTWFCKMLKAQAQALLRHGFKGLGSESFGFRAVRLWPRLANFSIWRFGPTLVFGLPGLKEPTGGEFRVYRASLRLL